MSPFRAGARGVPFGCMLGSQHAPGVPVEAPGASWEKSIDFVSFLVHFGVPFGVYGTPFQDGPGVIARLLYSGIARASPLYDLMKVGSAYAASIAEEKKKKLTELGERSAQ